MMAKNASMMISILILFSFLSFVQTQEWITYEKDKGFSKEFKDAPKMSRYKIDFKSESPVYMKITVVSDTVPAPLLCYSSDDTYCESREILAKNPNGKEVFVWVKKTQYQDKLNEPYIVVTCPGEAEKCSYIIKGSEPEGGKSYAVLDTNFVYSYLVTTKNTEMNFKIENTTELTSDDRIVFCLEGPSTVSITSGSSITIGEKIDNIGCTTLIGNQLGEDWGLFTIKAAEDDYVTISAHIYKVEGNPGEYLGRAKEGFALPNGPTVSSYFGEGTTEECFPLTKDVLSKSSNKLYITGKIHTKHAWFFLEKEDGTYIEETEVDIIGGQLAAIIDNPQQFRYVCFEIPSEFLTTPMLYSFKIVDYQEIISTFSYTDPMNSGEIYRRLLPKGTIDYYYIGNYDHSIDSNDYTLSNIKGMAKLYIAKCDEFPNCIYTKKDLVALNESIPSQVNNQWIWSYKAHKKEHDNAIYYQKTLMVVYCEDTKIGGDYCEFETSFFSRGQDINLIEGQKFYKYLYKDDKGNLDKGNFVINLGQLREFTRLTVEIMLFSGDVSFSLIEKISSEKFYLSNKILFNIYEKPKPTGTITLEYKANLCSFFNIKFTVDSVKEQSEDYITSGESFLFQMNPVSTVKTRTLYMSNFFGNQTQYMANFYSLNCDFTVKRKGTEIEFADGYAQDNIEKNQLEGDYYKYDISIKKIDSSSYTNKMCMMYISGFEIEQQDDTIIREVVVGHNINQQIIFEEEKNFKKIRFTYPIADISKDITFHINVIDKAHYRINGYLNGEIKLENLNIAVTSTYYLYYYDLDPCIDKQVCSLSLDVELIEKIVPTDPMIEVTFREVKNPPSYLPKNNAKIDYVCGDKLYYLYTEIGRFDVAEITLNFLREFGAIYARVVKKELQSPEQGANWRQYRMPGPDWDDDEELPFNNYTKKLTIPSEKTEQCGNGCYLLMAIKINEVGSYVEDSIFYSFSILTKITPEQRYYKDMPKVVIQVDEYIVGSLDVTEMDENHILEFYEVWLPHDSDTVEIDWQSSLADLYVTIGDPKRDLRPDKDTYDFVLHPPGRHSIQSIYKNPILEKAKEKGVIDKNCTSIQDLSLIIGVWTDKTDSINYELYSLRVHQYIQDEDKDLGIIEINSDQKIICHPKSHQEGYSFISRCLFVISYVEDSSFFSPIYLYATSVDPGASVTMLGSFINRTIYDTYDVDQIKKVIPTKQSAQYNTAKEGVSYIYIESTDPMKKYLFLNIYSDRSNDIVLINSQPIFNLISQGILSEIFPNSHTEQLFSLQKGQLEMQFPGEEGTAATIEVVSGEAEINLVNDTSHKVKGEGDRITILGDKNKKKLIIRYTKEYQNQLGDMSDPGFLFFITYKARKSGLNFDEVTFEKNTEISYKSTQLPVILYCKLGNVYKDLNIAIQFKDNSDQVQGSYETSPIKVIGTIMKEESVYLAKKKGDMDMRPQEDKSVYGYYDPAIKTASIYFSKKKIDSYNIFPEYNPTLYLRIEKDEIIPDIFQNFNIETQVAGINDEAIPAEKVYHYGKLGVEQQNVFYKLKLKRSIYGGYQFVRIHISFNNPDMDFCVHRGNNYLQNDSFPYDTSSRERGKVIFTFIPPEIENDYLYLNIFRKEGVTPNEKLSNYVFKYINAQSEDGFYDYSMKSPEIEIEEGKSASKENTDLISCTFNQIIVKGEANITYFLKVVENSTYVYPEDMNSIAATESPYSVSYTRNPIPNVPEDRDKIKLFIDGKFSNWGSVNVIAQVQQNNIIEYVAYKAIMNIRKPPKEEEKEDEGTDNTVLFAVIGSVLGAVVIALVAVIVYFQIRNKSLMNQVKHVSFQKTNINTDPNLLLKKENDPINEG